MNKTIYFKDNQVKKIEKIKKKFRLNQNKTVNIMVDVAYDVMQEMNKEEIRERLLNY